MTGTFGSSRSVYMTLLPRSLLPPIQSILSSIPPRFIYGRHHAQTPLLLSCLRKSNPHSVALVATSTSRETASPVPWSTRRFRDIPATLAELNVAGLHSQTVNDLLTMYVGAASQHVPCTTFVPEDEAKSFNAEGVGFWSPLIQRDATSPLFHMHLKLGA